MCDHGVRHLSGRVVKETNVPVLVGRDGQGKRGMRHHLGYRPHFAARGILMREYGNYDDKLENTYVF